MQRSLLSALIAPLLALAFLSNLGCDSAGVLDTSGVGTLRLYLTDAPFPFELVDSANVTIRRIDLVAAADTSARLTLSTDSLTFNLLDLRDGVTALLADTLLPAGSYAQVRLIVDDAAIVLKDGARFDLKVPGGAQTGIKVLLSGLTIAPDSTSEVTLDFDVSRSFVVQGNPNTPAGIKGFLFKPVIKPLSHGDDEAGDTGD